MKELFSTPRTHKKTGLPIRSTDWIKCSECLAKIGYGATIVSRVIGRNHKTVKKKWKELGIKSKPPKCGNWVLYAKQKQQPAKKVMAYYERLWMKEIKSQVEHGFSWSKYWANDLTMIKAGKPMIKIWSGRTKKTEEEKRQQINKHRRKYRKRRRLRDPGYRVKRNMRGRLSDLMKTAKKGGSTSISVLLGCSTRQLAEHLESMFTPEMTWNNYGKYWHVDHILPCASFDHTNHNQVKQCWHWTNLQPMEANENRAKSDTIHERQMDLIIPYHS